MSPYCLRPLNFNLLDYVLHLATPGEVVRHDDYTGDDIVEGCGVYKYDHYLRIRLSEAWHVPELLGRMPAYPLPESGQLDKASYALFAMLLFKPWRNMERDLMRLSSETVQSFCGSLYFSERT